MTTTQDCCREATACRAGGGPLHEILALGNLHLSAFLRTDEPTPPAYPLTLTIGENSHLVQLRHTVDQNALYRNYWYRSGTNEAMATHLALLANNAARRVHINPGDVVVDIGCNDGTLLRSYPGWVYKIGYDPSNIAPIGVDMYINDFFTPEKYPYEKKAKIVTSIAMFYDLDDPVAFARNIGQILSDDGLWVCEMHYLRAMIDTNGFDAICHEHLAYYDLLALEYVLNQAGLYVIDVEQNQVNGGSFRAYIAKRGEASPAVYAMRSAEWDNPINFDMFCDKIKTNQQRVCDLLNWYKKDGKLVLGYGASTKGSTMAQFYQITEDLMPMIADRNPLKWGLRCSGTDIPVISEDAARKMKPDIYLAFPYHFIDGFLRREVEHIQRGGKFMVTIPSPRLLP